MLWSENIKIKIKHVKAFPGGAMTPRNTNNESYVILTTPWHLTYYAELQSDD